MFCEHCGTKMEEGAQFCPSCGKSTSESPKAVAAVAASGDSSLAIIKCGNCHYEGPAEKARNVASMILAWLCIFFAPIITLIYFAVTHKYRCPKCKSTFLGVKNKEGNFVAQGKSPVMIFVWVLVGIAIIGILASVVLASLNTAREKGRQAQEQSAGLNR